MNRDKIYTLIIIIVILIITLILFINITINHTLQKTLYYPYRDHVWEPTIKHKKIVISDSNIQESSDLGSKFKQLDGISAWHFDNYVGNKTVLFCHGNVGNISHRRYIIELCDQQKLNLIVFDYSGYGYSRGYCSQDKICHDGTLVYQYLSSQINPEDIIIWGESLGGSVATYLASRYQCASLILMCTFSSIDDIIIDSNLGNIIKVLGMILPFFANNLPSREKIKDVQSPIIIIHSIDDELIPYSNARRLYNCISHIRKKLITITGDHGKPKILPQDLREILYFCGVESEICKRTRKILKTIQVERGEDLLPLHSVSSVNTSEISKNYKSISIGNSRYIGSRAKRKL